MSAAENLDGPNRPESVVKAYRERFSYLKKAKEHYGAGDIVRGVEKYKIYLNSLSNYLGVTEEKLKPSLFNEEKELAELLLVSHVYWDLAKAYDRCPTLHDESQRCLDQFSLFTIGYKYQHINSRLVKKYVKQKMAHNLPAFKRTYEQIYVDAKGCYVSTVCYGDQHPVTVELRRFKVTLLKTKVGHALVPLYYENSPGLIRRTQSLPGFLKNPIILIARLLLKSIACVHARIIGEFDTKKSNR